MADVTDRAGEGAPVLELRKGYRHVVLASVAMIMFFAAVAVIWPPDRPVLGWSVVLLLTAGIAAVGLYERTRISVVVDGAWVEVRQTGRVPGGRILRRDIVGLRKVPHRFTPNPFRHDPTPEGYWELQSRTSGRSVHILPTWSADQIARLAAVLASPPTGQDAWGTSPGRIARSTDSERAQAREAIGMPAPDPE